MKIAVCVARPVFFVMELQQDEVVYCVSNLMANHHGEEEIEAESLLVASTLLGERFCCYLEILVQADSEVEIQGIEIIHVPLVLYRCCDWVHARSPVLVRVHRGRT
jgi:hypothetical protein